MILCLIRHAEPTLTKYAGFPGPNLGDLGKKQALLIADFLQTIPIQQVLTSDYIRVLETLEPYQTITKMPFLNLSVLRERENEVETHEELVSRIHDWFEFFLSNNTDNTAIFSHCGPINMILFYLDKYRKKLEYPFECKYLCLTPKAGIWVLHIDNQELVSGKLITSCC